MRWLMILYKRPYEIALDKVGYVVSQGDRSITILDDVSAVWKQQCSVALRGISGSGKSTLLSIIAGLLYPTSGLVRYGDYRLDRTAENAWRDIRLSYLGYVFQAPLLIPELSVVENVMTRGLIQSGKKSELYEEAYTLLDHLGVAAIAETKVAVLSGGEQQRVSLARALFGKPAFVLMDEPTAHLDAGARKRFLELIATVQREYLVGIIIATHDTIISDTMNEVWNIDHGKLEQTR
jgi:ABC-type lipoprotein export system ATPase subunit